MQKKVDQYAELSDDLMTSNSYLLNFVSGYEKLQDEIQELEMALQSCQKEMKAAKDERDAF